MKYEIENIQKKCIEILDIVDKICHKHNIQYSLLNDTFIITPSTINRFYNLGLYLTWLFSKTISMTEL